MGQPSGSTVVCRNTQPSLHSRVRAGCPSVLPGRPTRFGGHYGDSYAVHQHIHFPHILLANYGRDKLFGTTDILVVLLCDLHANGPPRRVRWLLRLRPDRRAIASARTPERTASHCPPPLPCVLPQVRTLDPRYPIRRQL